MASAPNPIATVVGDDMLQRMMLTMLQAATVAAVATVETSEWNSITWAFLGGLCGAWVCEVLWKSEDTQDMGRKIVGNLAFSIPSAPITTMLLAPKLGVSPGPLLILPVAMFLAIGGVTVMRSVGPSWLATFTKVTNEGIVAVARRWLGIKPEQTNGNPADKPKDHPEG